MKKEFDEKTGFPLWLPESLRYKRFININDLPKYEEQHCRWCGIKIDDKRKRTWCSQVCVDEYMLFSSSSCVIDKVYDRDHGVCSVCGIDTDELMELMLFTYRYYDIFCLQGRKDWGVWHCKEKRRRFWEADHVVPVSEGGGCCGLQNYRTLCLPCHKNETAELSRRRSGATRYCQMDLDFL